MSVEYLITKRGDEYRISIGGQWACPIFANPNDARLWCLAHARSIGQPADIIEVFARVALRHPGAA